MLLNQREPSMKFINRIGKDPAISNARILNKEGEIIYSAHKDDIGKMLINAQKAAILSC